MRYLTVPEVLEIYRHLMQQSGGTAGVTNLVTNLGALESAVAQPRMKFGGQELYPTIVEKASALGFSLIKNHPFLDGNKRIGHAAMEVFLVLNGFEIYADVDEQEKVILKLASGELGREEFTQWLGIHLIKR
jgi:death on curing protein